MIKYLVRISAVLIVLALAGCGTPRQELLNGNIVTANTVSDSPDRSGTLISEWQRVGTDPATGQPLIRPTPVSQQLTVGPTVRGQATVAAVSGTGAALIQGVTTLGAIKMKGDCGDNCGGDQFILQGGQALAAANAQNQDKVKVDVDVGQNSGGGCPSGGCGHKDFDF